MHIEDIHTDVQYIYKTYTQTEGYFTRIHIEDIHTDVQYIYKTYIQNIHTDRRIPQTHTH